MPILRKILIASLSLFFLFGTLSPSGALTLIKKKSGPVFSTGISHPWDREEVEVSSVLYENGKFRMWYSGYDGGVHRIGLAESEDGAVWIKHSTPVLEPRFEEEGTEIGHPTVIKDGDLYKMWFVVSNQDGAMIAYAVSSDGIQWKKKEISVFNLQSYEAWKVREVYYPCVIKEKGLYRMYFAGFDGRGYAVGLVLSTDGISWKPHADAPVLFGVGQGPSRESGANHPFVRKDASGKFEMWFSQMEEGRWAIRRAVSLDGIRWEKDTDTGPLPREKLGFWDALGAFRPVVGFHDGQYSLWYSGSDGYRVRTGRLTSRDAKTWVKDAGNPVLDVGEGRSWESASLNGGTLLKEGDFYKIWYSGYNGSKIRIGTALSRDGIHWEKNHDNPVVDTGKGEAWDRMGVAYPSVLKGDDGLYRMWYLGYDGVHSGIGAATSRDGIHWIKDKRNPVFFPGKAGQWDGSGVAYVTVLQENGNYKMWYSGADGKVTRIGLATSPDGIRWERAGENPVLREGREGADDHLSVSFPCVLREEGGYRLWYAGLGEKGHKIFEARSKDGLHWERENQGDPVLEVAKGWEASEVKGAMVCGDGDAYLMAFEEAAGNTNVIGLARSEDGTRWNRSGSSYILDAGAGDGWDSYGVSGGWVIQDPKTNTYRMWYSGHDGKVFRVGLAHSPDGLNWERYVRNPVLDKGPLGSWDSERVAYPSVLFDNGVYKMWYHGYGGNTSPRIGYAVSRDGVHWEKQGEGGVVIPGAGGEWDAFAVGYPCVHKEGDLYHLWYAGLDRNYGTWRIGHAQSDDGVHWKKHQEGAVLDVGRGVEWDAESVSYPMVIKRNTGFLLFYVGYRGRAFRIGTASSQDGVHWTKEANNPLINVGAEGEFDAGSALAPRVMMEGGKYRIWYTGIQEGRYQIGYAEAMEGEVLTELDRKSK